MLRIRPIFSLKLSFLSINALSASLTVSSALFTLIDTSTFAPALTALISSSVRTLLIISSFDSDRLVSGTSSFFTISTFISGFISSLIIGITVMSALSPHTVQ